MVLSVHGAYCCQSEERVFNGSESCSGRICVPPPRSGSRGENLPFPRKGRRSARGWELSKGSSLFLLSVNASRCEGESLFFLLRFFLGPFAPTRIPPGTCCVLLIPSLSLSLSLPRGTGETRGLTTQRTINLSINLSICLSSCLSPEEVWWAFLTSWVYLSSLSLQSSSHSLIAFKALQAISLIFISEAFHQVMKSSHLVFTWWTKLTTSFPDAIRRVLEVLCSRLPW